MAAETSAADGPEATAATPTNRPDATPARPARPSITKAFRAAIRPVDLRGDLAALPTIARHSKAIWLPGLLVLVAGGSVLAVGGVPKNFLVDMLFQVVLFPPAMVPAFLAGLLAPRASYLAGGITGVLAAIAFGIVIALVEVTVLQPDGSRGPLTPEQRFVFLENAIALGIPFSILVGAFSGFYRRFLALSNPNYGRPRPRPSKPTGRRR
jgi:hypothetical protein